jgi:hypothetical protein
MRNRPTSLYCDADRRSDRVIAIRTIRNRHKGNHAHGLKISAGPFGRRGIERLALITLASN